MAKVSGKSLSFGFSVEREISNLQSFIVAVDFSDITATAGSYRARNSFDFVFPRLGEAFLAGEFIYEDPDFVFASNEVSGTISSFSFANVEDFDPVTGVGNGFSGIFQVSDLGETSIDFVDFISLQPSDVAAAVLKGKDKIEGSAFDDSLDGYSGKDKIRGGDGNDLLLGGKGSDRLFGDDGDDTLKGEKGNDILDGGKGFNKLIGGSGRDVFKFNKKGVQRVMDFNPLEDKIDLPGPESEFDQFSFFQKNDTTVLVGYAGDDIESSFNLLLKGNQPFAIENVNLI